MSSSDRDFSVSTRPFGFGFETKGLGPRLDNTQWAKLAFWEDFYFINSEDFCQICEMKGINFLFLHEFINNYDLSTPLNTVHAKYFGTKDLGPGL